MTTLDTQDGYFAAINTFSVEPGKADQLLQGLIDVTERDISRRPGFVSANFHVSKDRNYVANYAQWRSKEDQEAVLSDPAAMAGLKAATGAATRVDPIVYDLVATFPAQR